MAKHSRLESSTLRDSYYYYYYHHRRRHQHHLRKQQHSGLCFISTVYNYVWWRLCYKDTQTTRWAFTHGQHTHTHSTLSIQCMHTALFQCSIYSTCMYQVDTQYWCIQSHCRNVYENYYYCLFNSIVSFTHLDGVQRRNTHEVKEGTLW